MNSLVLSPRRGEKGQLSMRLCSRDEGCLLRGPEQVKWGEVVLPTRHCLPYTNRMGQSRSHLGPGTSIRGTFSLSNV